MTEVQAILALLLAAYLFLSIAATIVIFRLDYFDKPQAIGQTLIVWVVPLVGAIFVLIFQAVVHKNMTTKAERDAEAKNNPDGDADALLLEFGSDE